MTAVGTVSLVSFTMDQLWLEQLRYEKLSFRYDMATANTALECRSKTTNVAEAVQPSTLTLVDAEF